MRCPNCSKENPPDAQFCMRCGTALTRACPVCGTANSLESQFCLRCGSPLGQAALAERRVLSILFADLVESTTLSQQFDPERMRVMIGRYFEAMREEIERYGGTVEKFIGDAVMAIFGLPVAHEDDPLRAVRAALAMQRRMSELNTNQPATFHLRIAVTTGEVVADPLFASSGQFMVTGETVNFAARLQAQAPPDGIVVDDRTYAAVEHAVDANLLPPVETGEFSGRTRWQITRLAERPSIKRLRAKMVGRNEELQFLLALFRRVVDGRRLHVATILGPAGVGKTRLAEEFLHAVGQTPAPPEVLSGRCPAYGEGLTYRPIVEMLKQESGIRDSDPLPDVARKLRDRVLAVCAPVLGEEEAEAVAADLSTLLGVELSRGYEVMWRSRLQTLKYLVENRPAAALREPGAPSEPRHSSESVLQALRLFLTAKAHRNPVVLPPVICYLLPSLMEKFEVIEHTADVGIVAYGHSLEELFANAAAGMMHFLIDKTLIRMVERRTMTVEADDRESLLINWLSDLLVVLNADAFIPADFNILELTETRLTAEIAGEPVDPMRHVFRLDVKAATYHALEIGKNDYWHARIIFDV